MPAVYETLEIARPEPGILVASMHRPQSLNAVSFQMFEEFVQLQNEVDEDTSVRALVLTGSGRAFCAGLDLAHAAELPTMAAIDMLTGQESWARSVTGFRTMATPVIAAVNGAAAGAGMAIALAADIRIASSEARFNAAFVKIGLSGGDVGTSWTLPRLIGLGRATEILMTGRFVDAEEALRIGLVTNVVTPERLMPLAIETARAICANSPVGVALTKQVLNLNVDAPSLDAALALENRNQVFGYPNGRYAGGPVGVSREENSELRRSIDRVGAAGNVGPVLPTENSFGDP